MLSFSRRILFLFLLLSSLGLSAQNSNNLTITGKVYDEKAGVGLPGATVHLKNTTHEVVTDKDGVFRFLTGQKLPVVLIVTYIGYQGREVSEASSRNIEIGLRETIGQLNDVVVVGYGTQRKRDLTSSISVIKGSEVTGVPVASFDGQLQGKAPGLQINSNAGVPGDGIFVRVRGTTSVNADNNPLYIIDGVFVNNTSLQTVNSGGRATSPLADINPADIENIEVLKDASATAIYGSRGANGVVIVTTRRGNFNAHSRLNLDVSTGAAWAPKLWDLTTGPQHALLENEFYTNSYADAVASSNSAGIAKYATQPFLGAVLNPGATTARGTPDLQKTHDRLHEIFRTGNLQNYNVSLSGGNKETRYYFGGGYTRQEADIKPLFFQRASFKLNVDSKVNDYIQVGASNNFSRTFRNQGRAGDGPAGGLLQSALHTPTYLPETNVDGTPARWAGFDNLQVLLKNYDVNTVSLRYIGNFYVDAIIARDFKFHSTFSVDYNNYNESEYWNNLTQLGAAPTNGLATSNITQNTTWINEQTLSWRKTLASRHNLGVLVGNTVQSNKIINTFAQGSGFPSNSYKNISSAATRTSADSSKTANLASFFARIDYNFSNKYYLELSARADGSSKFGANNKWGYFPSVGVSWRAKEESFLKSVESVSDLKLRASYGITGNQNGISFYAAQGLWSGGYGYPDGSTGDQPGTAPLQLGNPNLKWERTQQANVGLDLGLFGGRVSVDLNLYYKYTNNVLLSLPIPGISGFSAYNSNAGEISNKGYELGINTVNIRNGEWSWQTAVSISGNVNKVEKLPTPIYQYNRNWIIMQQGSPMYSFWLYKQLYVDPKTGASVFEGQTNGTLPVAARQVLHNAMPKFFGGINNTVSWRGIDLSVFFSYQYGNYTYNLNKFFGEGGGTRDANRVMFADQLNRWQKPGDVTNVPRVTAYGLSYTVDQNSRFLEDASFIRLKTVNIGYTLPRRISAKLKIETLRVYVSGTNLWLLTKYTGPDPEANVTGIQTIQGLDLGTPPQPRTLQVGLNVTL